MDFLKFRKGGFRSGQIKHSDDENGVKYKLQKENHGSDVWSEKSEFILPDERKICLDSKSEQKCLRNFVEQCPNHNYLDFVFGSEVRRTLKFNVDEIDMRICG